MIFGCFTIIFQPKVSSSFLNLYYFNQYDIIKSNLANPNCNETVTYTTYGDHEFMDNLPMLISRWNGPISLALFTPGTDYLEALKAVAYYRW